MNVSLIARQAFSKYTRYLAAHPVLTKSATAATCATIADLLAQSSTGGVSPDHVIQFAAYAATVSAPIGHAWNRVLERHVFPGEPGALKTVATKTALDQFVLSPATVGMFILAMNCHIGFPDAMAVLADKYASTLLASYYLWIPVTLAVFKFVPEDFRILVNALVSIAWIAYLSLTV